MPAPGYLLGSKDLDKRGSEGYPIKVNARLLALLLLAAACASPRPVLYPDERLKSVGEDAAKADIDDCLAQAKTYLKANPVKPIARKTGWGSAVGAAMGAVTGAITGDLSRAVASGAAIGAVGGAAHGVAESASPDAVQRAFTQRCLAEKGYSVIGWR